MTDPGEALEAAIDLMESAYYAARKALVDARELELRLYPDATFHSDPMWRDWTPELAKDAHGRFVLLDALTALVEARTSLYRASPDASL